jgi:hypothetical protein
MRPAAWNLDESPTKQLIWLLWLFRVAHNSPSQEDRAFEEIYAQPLDPM